MNKPALNHLVLTLLPATLVVLSSCSSTPTPPAPSETDTQNHFEPGVPGGVRVKTTDVNARVTAINKATREVTLLGADGEPFTVKAGPEAANYSQIRVGDLVKATVTEKLVVQMAEAGKIKGGGTSSVVMVAPEGAAPGAIASETKQVIGTIVALDPAKHTATFKFNDGTTKTFPVRPDVDLNQRKVGEKVLFRHTETIAISLEKS